MYLLLPGMGANHRMYPHPWTALPGARHLDWAEHRGETTIAQVAERITTSEKIDASTWLVGSSLGGMVACEVAKQTTVRGIVLVGSAAHPQEINRLLRWAQPAADLAPLRFSIQLSRILPGEFFEMFGESDPGFIQAMCMAVAEWPGIESSPCRMHRIHGRYDKVIPLPSSVDAIIEGGHLIAMTHPDECVMHVRQLTEQ